MGEGLLNESDDEENVADEPSLSFDPKSIVEMAFDPNASLPSTDSVTQSTQPRKPNS